MVTSASVPAPPGSATSRASAWVTRSGRAVVSRAHLVAPSSGVVVGVVRVLPDDGAALAQADAHRGQAVADVRVLLELAGQLGHQAHARRGQRVADGDRAAVLVDARVVVGDAERVEEGEHLDGERLVDLEQADVLDGQAGPVERLDGGRHRADAHDLGLDPGVRERHHPHARGQAELGGGLLGGEQAGRGAVGEGRGGPGGDPATRAERGGQLQDRLDRGAGARRLVGGGQAPAVLRVAQRDRDEVGVDLPGGQRRGVLGLAGDAVRVGPLTGQGGELVVQVLRGHAHVEGVVGHEALGQEARVGVGVEAHRVVPHVLDASRQRDVLRAEPDGGGRVGHRGHRAGAHAVDRVAGDGPGEPGEDADRAAEGQALVALLRGRGDGDLVDALRRELGVAAQQLADGLDREVVGAGVGVQPVLARAAERGADPVDEHDAADEGCGSRRCGGHRASRAGRRCPTSTRERARDGRRYPGGPGVASHKLLKSNRDVSPAGGSRTPRPAGPRRGRSATAAHRPPAGTRRSSRHRGARAASSTAGAAGRAAAGSRPAPRGRSRASATTSRAATRRAAACGSFSAHARGGGGASLFGPRTDGSSASGVARPRSMACCHRTARRRVPLPANAGRAVSAATDPGSACAAATIACVGQDAAR